jgi:hypothetical protein
LTFFGAKKMKYFPLLCLLHDQAFSSFGQCDELKSFKNNGYFPPDLEGESEANLFQTV